MGRGTDSSFTQPDDSELTGKSKHTRVPTRDSEGNDLHEDVVQVDDLSTTNKLLREIRDLLAAEAPPFRRRRR